jgi:hypothetical protein
MRNGYNIVQVALARALVQEPVLGGAAAVAAAASEALALAERAAAWEVGTAAALVQGDPELATTWLGRAGDAAASVEGVYLRGRIAWLQQDAVCVGLCLLLSLCVPLSTRLTMGSRRRHMPAGCAPSRQMPTMQAHFSGSAITTAALARCEPHRPSSYSDTHRH